MNINAISNRVRCNNSGITEGHITYACGHTEPYRSSSAFGFGMVSGMSAGVQCEACHLANMKLANELAPLLAERQQAFDSAVQERNTQMAALKIDYVQHPDLTAQADVFRALRLLNESEWAVRFVTGR